jgi:hypothetical protein
MSSYHSIKKEMINFFVEILIDISKMPDEMHITNYIDQLILISKHQAMKQGASEISAIKSSNLISDFLRTYPKIRTQKDVEECYKNVEKFVIFYLQ